MAQHSLGGYKIVSRNDEGISQESLVIACLLHDICKDGMLMIGRCDGKPHKRQVNIKGNGRRSVKQLEYIYNFKLTDEERRDIRWHMGRHYASESEKKDLEQVRKSKLLFVVCNVDHRDTSYGKKSLHTSIKP